MVRPRRAHRKKRPGGRFASWRSLGTALTRKGDLTKSNMLPLQVLLYCSGTAAQELCKFVYV